MPTYKAKGQRGSWFAEVNGERLPCVHDYWCSKTGTMTYDDPNFKPGGKKWDELSDAIGTLRRVILTRDKAINGGLGFERLGYIAIFEVENVEVGADNHLRFRFTKRLADLT